MTVTVAAAAAGWWAKQGLRGAFHSPPWTADGGPATACCRGRRHSAACPCPPPPHTHTSHPPPTPRARTPACGGSSHTLRGDAGAIERREVWRAARASASFGRPIRRELQGPDSLLKRPDLATQLVPGTLHRMPEMQTIASPPPARADLCEVRPLHALKHALVFCCQINMRGDLSMTAL